MANKQIILAKRPQGQATADCFQCIRSPIPDVPEGGVLVKALFTSADPSMRGRMNDVETYTKPQELGKVMGAYVAGEVVDSKATDFPVGCHVLGELGWQQYIAVSDLTKLTKIDTSVLSPSLYLGTLGITGLTAWVGLNKILKPKAGETVVVSAAAGAVGTVVGQLAKQRGCRVIGIAGGKDKCDYVVNDLGFDGCIDYKIGTKNLEEPVAAALKKLAPNGVDCYFENVGGSVSNGVMRCMNAFGRIAMCGLIASYDGRPYMMTAPNIILLQRLLVQGFIVTEHEDVFPQALEELTQSVREGKIKCRETTVDGIEAAPEALLGLFRGSNVGKLIIRV